MQRLDEGRGMPVPVERRERGLRRGAGALAVRRKLFSRNDSEV